MRGVAAFGAHFNICHYEVLVHEQGSMRLPNKLRKVIIEILEIDLVNTMYAHCGGYCVSGHV